MNDEGDSGNGGVGDALFNPLAGNPLRRREDIERAARALFQPLLPHFSQGGARVKLGHSGVLFSEGAEQLEGFARPLWGMVPLAMGGGRFDHWELYRRGLTSGSNPEHSEFWGWAQRDQRQVEMAAIGFALAFLPEQVWEPLTERARDHLVAWLERINQHLPVPNNWQFFRVMVNLGLGRVGRFRSQEAERESLELLESWYQGDGWYRDGSLANVDYYVPWAFHTYGLLYAAAHSAHGLGEAERAAAYRERARLFARDFQHWFDPRGAAIPFGRSLTYRFAQACFWGALVFADEPALPWGRIKGLYLRHLRDWATRPIADGRGVLSIGYGYPNLLMSDPYNSAGSPYWAMKFFLALAAPEEHPFWQAEEEPLPDRDGLVAQPHAGMLLSRDGTQAVALSAGQSNPLYPNGAARYGKLAYSSRFGFSVALHESRPHHNCHDSALSLREPGGTWRVRDEIEERSLEGEFLYSLWRPWPDVTVETVLTGRCPWHLRLHRVTSARRLRSCETGFALGWEGIEPGRDPLETLGEQGAPLFRTPWGFTGIRDLRGQREAQIQPAPPNTNLIEPRTVVPVMLAEHQAGCFVLASAVLATDREEAADWSLVPDMSEVMLELLEQRKRGDA
jgi:hypothetical protein